MIHGEHPVLVTTGATSHASGSKTNDTTMVEEEDAVKTDVDWYTPSGSTTEDDILDDPEI